MGEREDNDYTLNIGCGVNEFCECIAVSVCARVSNGCVCIA